MVFCLCGYGTEKQKPRSLGVMCERGKLPTPGVWLEVDLSSKLEDSRVKGRSDLAEPAVTEACIHVVELSMVPGVEGFQTQFQTAAARFDEREALEQRQVPVVASRSAHIVVWNSSPSADGRSGKRIRAEPPVDRMRSRECASEVWPVIAAYAVALLIASEGDVNGQARLQGDDAGDLPATNY